jgi:hypothetical protein
MRSVIPFCHSIFSLSLIDQLHAADSGGGGLAHDTPSDRNFYG